MSKKTVRIVIVGHVDHGKSTLIGRILLDTESLPKENLAEIKRISKELGKVYRNLVIRYGQWSLLPDADLVIYEPITCRVLGVISCKITLRERIGQTAYWKLKLASDPLTMHIKGYFVTADEDGDLVQGLSNPSRNRILVEHELDGTYALRPIAESEKVKAFPKLLADLQAMMADYTVNNTVFNSAYYSSTPFGLDLNQPNCGIVVTFRIWYRIYQTNPNVTG